MGYTLAWYIVRGAFVAWEPAPLPTAQQLDRFIVGSDAYVRTKHGKLFVQDISELSNEWEEVERVSMTSDMHGSICSNEEIHSHYQIRKPPGVVVEQLDCTHGHIEAQFPSRYVFLENGELWRWRLDRYGGLGGLWVQLQYSVGVALVSGFIALILFTLHQEVKRSRLA
jgi:hypothetical protein